jgi:hypothetical protein
VNGKATVTRSASSTASAPATIDLESRIEQLLRHDGGELDAFVVSIERDVPVPNTRGRVHCNLLSLDGNGMPRTNDLARWLTYHVIDYAIPRGQIVDAKTYDQAHNSTRRMAELKAKAVRLFTQIAKTGEPGELLLYILAQSQLRLPQLFCKMPHKTSPNVHVHGTDGIHVGIDPVTRKLMLYWGESKLYQSVTSAVTEALDSIKPFICREGGSGASYERDLQLMRDNLDLNDADLEDAILHFLDRDDPQHNQVQFRGMCLIGFDHAVYPTTQNEKDIDAIIGEARMALQAWLATVEALISNRPPLASIHLELFLVPFPSVADFRTAFLNEMRCA